MIRTALLALSLLSSLGAVAVVGGELVPSKGRAASLESTGTLSGRLWFAICCDCSDPQDPTGMTTYGNRTDRRHGDDDDDSRSGSCGGRCCNCPEVDDELSPFPIGTKSWGSSGDDDDDDGGSCDGSGALDLGGVTLNLFDAAGSLVDSQITDSNGRYTFSELPAGTYQLQVSDLTLPSGAQAIADFDGSSSPNSALLQVGNGEQVSGVDFGYGGCAPGTGTLGYWKNHPEAWPEEAITLGGVTYSKNDAIAIMNTPSRGDKTYDMFKQLAAAILNVQVGNPNSCVSVTIAAADSWLTTYPLGSRVRGSSSAWGVGSPLHVTLDDYNNGLLCAPHRD